MIYMAHAQSPLMKGASSSRLPRGSCDTGRGALCRCAAVCCAGHRSTRPTSLPLKRGMMHYAYSRRLPVQIIVTKGKEHVLSEKTMSIHFGRTLVTGFSKVGRRGEGGAFAPRGIPHMLMYLWAEPRLLAGTHACKMQRAPGCAEGAVGCTPWLHVHERVVPGGACLGAEAAAGERHGRRAAAA